MRRSLLCLCMFALTSLLVIAHTATGGLRGIVRDSVGAVMPGVVVTATRDDDGAAHRTVTNERGEFMFAELTPGRYTVTAALAGFNTAVHQLAILEGTVAELNPSLEVGALEETVTVTGATPTVGAQMAQRDSNTEDYDRRDDNQWRIVRSQPLSTVSIDVDTASYTNLRRFLRDGELPPPDAVRIEELINFFSYDYPEPKGRASFSVTTATGDAPWQKGHRLLLIGLQGRHLDQSQVPPRNLVFLIDVSGSMEEPNKLPLVKQSLAMLARHLRPVDRVSIVVYAGAAGVVLPPTSGGNVTTILDALAQLEAGGSTNGAGGIVEAYALAREQFIAGGVNRVILATDGDFNVGVTSRGDLVRLIEEQREHGVTLSVLGYGMGNLKDSSLEQLADRGNGNYAYIDTLEEARRVLVDQGAGTLVTIAKDVKLQVEFNPRLVARYRLIGYENRVLAEQDFADDTKDAGDMGAGHSVTAIYEIVPAPTFGAADGDALKYQEPRELAAAADRDELATVKIRFKKPDGNKSALTSVIVKRNAGDATARRTLGFASAVAEFGMLLRDSPFKSNSSFDQVRALAEQHLGPDPDPYRSEFLELVGTAERLWMIGVTR